MNGLKKDINIIIHFLKLSHKTSKSYIPTLLLSSLFKSITPFLSIIVPKYIIDELLNKQRKEVFIILIAILILGNFFLNIINRLFNSLVKVKNEEFMYKFNGIIGEKIVDMDFENTEDPEVLDLKERALFAIYNEGALHKLVDSFTKLITQIISLIGFIAIISLLNPLIILLILGIITLNSRIYGKVKKLQFIANQTAIPGNRAFGYFGTLTANFSLGKDIRLYNMAPLILAKSKKFTSRILEINTKLYTTEGKYNGITNINLQFQVVIVYAYLCYKVIYSGLSIGNFTMFASAVSGFTAALSAIIVVFIEIGNCCKHLQHYRDFEAMVCENIKGDKSIEGIENHEIEFKNVYFKYPRSSEYVLKNICIKIHSGERLSVVGRNGAGKTTFIKLLTRLYEPSSGEILLDGKNINEFAYDEYIKLLSVVFQDFKLLYFTLKENIALNESQEASEEKIIDILNEAGLEEDLKKLPKGVLTSVYKNFDKDGIEFSGGQAQKIAIARAVYKDAPIIVLDEPTAALDPISEYEIYKKFNELIGNKTAVYISHRLSSCRFCDKIAVFHNGAIVQYGSHDKLILEKNKPYAEMYNAQAKYYV